MTEKQFLLAYDRKRTSTLTLDSEPGAHTGTTRQYIPGYSDSNIVFLDTVSGNDANDGSTELLAKLSYASAATAAGTTKKIRVINSGAALSTNITKPTEMKRGVSGTISSSLTAPVASLTAAATPAWTSGKPERVTWSPKLGKWYGVGSTEIVSSSDGDVWTLEETISGATGYRIFWSQAHERLYVLCTAGKLLYSSDGSTFTTQTIGTSTLGAIAYSESLGLYALGSLGYIYYSTDGLSWESVQITTDNGISAGVFADGAFVFFNGNGELFYSTDGVNWAKTNPLNGYEVTALTYMDNVSLFIAGDTDGEIWSSANGTTWTSRRSPPGKCFDAEYITETGVCVVCDNGRVLSYSTNGTSWTSTAALGAYGASDQIRGVSYSPMRGRIITVGGNDGSTTRINAYGPLYANTISANVAGFTIQAVQYSGTITAYNCTMKQPGTTANLSLNACRVTEAGSHISSNTATSFATLFEGDRHTTCTPAAQNDIDCNLDTVGGTWYIFNASETGFERIRDCIVTGGIIANFNVTVGGRANIQGDSENILIGAEVTLDDPKFVDTTDYKLQFQTNGYPRNSLAAGRSSIYFNSAGDARDIGAWSYVESAVSYYFAKSVVLYKGEITHEIEEVVSEQQGDSGVVSVYGNANRIKEIVTITYGSTKEEDRAFLDYMRSLKDKGVKLIIDAEWESNSGTVTVNGNQSAEVEFLTVDSTTYYNGMWVTVSGKRYWIMRASPSNSAATKLILDRPLEDAVTDNQVLVTNYPPGVGEYQFSPQSRLTLRRAAPDGLTGWQSGLILRFVRKYQ